MIIQCPNCSTRYRVKEMLPGRPDAHLACPNCKFHFILVAPLNEGDSPEIAASPTVLVVDDAHFFREMLVDLLLPLKLNVSIAANAADALKYLKSKPCDLMLLDLNLPDKNGLELIADIRADNLLNKTCIMAMSGVYRREEDGKAAIRAGADSFLSKSFRPEDLREKVRKLLS